MLRRMSEWKAAAFLLALVTLLAPVTATAADFKREVVYQIITDRFFDGSTANNNPPQSSGLYDSTKTNWRAYWGGDLAGIQQKMSYLSGMGVTAIWISPPVDNLNTNIPDGGGNPTASYHGYQGRDFKKVEEHSGDSANAWTAFDNLVTAAHQNGIKVIVDFAPNHTTQDNAGEFGAFYDNGTFVGNYTNDTNGYFHHNGNISNWDDRYQVQYYTLFNLADLNQAHTTVDAYLKASAKLFQDHGVDGFRIDAIKHLNWGWQYSLANSIYTYKDSFLFGEWYQTGTSDPLYRDSYKYSNKSGISMLDFPLNTADPQRLRLERELLGDRERARRRGGQLHLGRRPRHLHRQPRHDALPHRQQQPDASASGARLHPHAARHPLHLLRHRAVSRQQHLGRRRPLQPPDDELLLARRRPPTR